MNKTIKAKSTNKNRSKFISWIGFVTLAVMVFILLTATAYFSWKDSFFFGVLLSVLISFSILITFIFEAKSIRQEKNQPGSLTQQGAEFFAVILAGLLTFYLSNEVGLGLVVASGLIGVLTSIFFPKYKYAAYCGAAYCGSFVGMSSKFLLTNYNEFLLASIIAGLIFVIARNIFSGFGGKLGAIAFTSTTIAGLIFNHQFTSTAMIVDWKVNMMVILLAVIASSASFYLNNILNHGPVLASGIVGLTGGLILPAMFPEYGEVLSVVVICASFAGMSNRERFPHFGYMVLAGLLIGLLYVFSLPVFGGAGGKLGTIAFTAVLSIHGSKLFWNKKQEYNQNR